MCISFGNVMSQTREIKKQDAQHMPRSRKRTKAGRYSSDITFEELSECFNAPAEQACEKLGVCMTILKRITRKFGVSRWPYSQRKRAYQQQRPPVDVQRTSIGAQQPLALPTAAITEYSPGTTAIAAEPSGDDSTERWGVPAVAPADASRPVPRYFTDMPAALDPTLLSLGVAPKMGEAAAQLPAAMQSLSWPTANHLATTTHEPPPSMSSMHFPSTAANGFSSQEPSVNFPDFASQFGSSGASKMVSGGGIPGIDPTAVLALLQALMAPGGDHGPYGSGR